MILNIAIDIDHLSFKDHRSRYVMQPHTRSTVSVYRLHSSADTAHAKTRLTIYNLRFCVCEPKRRGAVRTLKPWRAGQAHLDRAIDKLGRVAASHNCTTSGEPPTRCRSAIIARHEAGRDNPSLCSRGVALDSGWCGRNTLLDGTRRAGVVTVVS